MTKIRLRSFKASDPSVNQFGGAWPVFGNCHTCVDWIIGVSINTLIFLNCFYIMFVLLGF